MYMEERMNLTQKLVEVRRTITYVQKTDKSKQGFMFVSSSNVLEKIRPALDEHGILIVPSVLKHEVSPHQYSNSSGYFTGLKIRYAIINADDPEDKITIDWYAQGIDSSEKGVGKALTYGEKYLFLKLFNIPTDKDDPDKHGEKNKEEPAETKKVEAVKDPKLSEEPEESGMSMDKVSMVSSLYDKFIEVKGKTNADGYYKFAKQQAKITAGIETGTPEQIAIVIQMLEKKLGE